MREPVSIVFDVVLLRSGRVFGHAGETGDGSIIIFGFEKDAAKQFCSLVMPGSAKVLIASS